MLSQARYVEIVRLAVGTATAKWELQGEGNAFNKPWETHNEAAAEVVRAELKASSHPRQVPSLVRTYYRTMAIGVRRRMAKKGIGCAAARKLVAARTLKLGAKVRDVVKAQAYRAAALLLQGAGDEWTTERSVMSNNAYIGGRAVWDSIVTTAQAAASNAFDARAQPRELSALFGLFVVEFMAAARTRRKADNLSWGRAKTRLTARVLTEGLPKDLVRAAAYTAAALMLEAISGGSSSTGTATCSEPSVGRSEPRRVLVPPAAATAAKAGLTLRKASPTPTPPCTTAAGTATAMMMLPPTGVHRTPDATKRYRSSGPIGAPTRTESANTVVGVGGRVTGQHSKKALPTSPIAETAAEVTKGGAARTTARPPSSGLPRCMVDSGHPVNGTPENMRKIRKEPLESGAAPGMATAAEAMGAGSGYGASTGPGPTPFSAVQGVGALGSGSSGLDTVPGDASTASGSATAATTPMCFPPAPMAPTAAGAAATVAATVAAAAAAAATSRPVVGPLVAGVGLEGAGASLAAGAAAAAAAADYQNTSNLLLGDDALGPDNSEMCGVGPDAPVASAAAAAAAVATAAAAATVVAAAASAAAAAESGLQGAGATVAALPAPLNNSETIDASMPSISSGRETMMGDNSGSDVDTDSGANGTTDDGGDGGGGGGGGSMLGAKRKADSSSASEGDSESQPCDGGATKKARAG